MYQPCHHYANDAEQEQKQCLPPVASAGHEMAGELFRHLFCSFLMKNYRDHCIFSIIQNNSGVNCRVSASITQRAREAMAVLWPSLCKRLIYALSPCPFIR